jgi:hypothetical protein
MVTLDEATHTYRTAEGVVVPGVTTILRAAGLIDTRWCTDYGRDRGTLVHLACEYDDRGILDDATVDDAIKGYVEAWRCFKATARFTPESMEVVVHNETYGYAGKYDVAGTMHGSKVIVDRKTGTVYPATGLQLAAYERCMGEPHKRMAVELHEDGKFKVEMYTDESDWQVFCATLAVYNWKQRKGIANG